MREMKDSGIEWIGRIPAEWRVLPAKAAFRESKARRSDDDVRLTPSQNYGVVSQADYMRITGSKIVLADKGLESWKHVEPNDYIMHLRSFQGGLEMSHITGCVTWHYIVLKANRTVCHDYYKHLFKSVGYIDGLRSTCQYLRDGQDLRYSNFIQVPLPEPPIDEQEKIAAFLDAKCAEIDAAIAAAEASIEEYELYRKSVIFQAVTKGLDDSVEMKDSGIEWIGAIPKSWTITRGKYLYAKHKDIAGTASENFERLALTMNGVIKRSKEASDGLQPANFDGYQILYKGDLVFKLIDLQNISTSRVGLSPYTGLVSPAYIVVTPFDKCDSRYLENFYLTMWRNEIFNAMGSGVRQSLGYSELSNSPVTLPSLSEQKCIAEYVARLNKRIDKIVATKQDVIEELKDYKKSLIYEVVTGKREVR